MKQRTVDFIIKIGIEVAKCLAIILKEKMRNNHNGGGDSKQTSKE